MGRQRKLEGITEKPVKEIDDAIDHYTKQARASTRQRQRTAEARDALVQVMHKHGKDVYTDHEHDPPLVVTIVAGKEKVKVSDGDSPVEETDDAEGAE